jgi:hypothetical protein
LGIVYLLLGGPAAILVCAEVALIEGSWAPMFSAIVNELLFEYSLDRADPQNAY